MMGNLKKDGVEYACFDDGDSGTPCMTEDGRIHSFFTSNLYTLRNDRKSLSLFTPAHFARSQAAQLVGSKLEFVDGSFQLSLGCSIF